MDKKLASKRLKELVKEINYHNKRYYVLDKPEISDEHYDVLYKELVSLEDQYPELVSKDSPTQRVGDKVKAGFKKVQHTKKRLSLEDVFSWDDFLDFNNRVIKLLGNQPAYTCELKIDGLQIVLTYKLGKLFQAVTRGDGMVGEDVLHTVRTIRDVPLKLKKPLNIVVSGEIYIELSEFKRINKERNRKGEELYANPRNLAAGTIRQLDPRVASQRRLSSFVYDLFGDNSPKTQIEIFKLLDKLGFKISLDHILCKNLDEIRRFIDKWEIDRAELSYMTDGIVIKVNNLIDRKKMGETAKMPRWAVAFKFPAEQAQTTINAITVQVGRTGALTPVAELNSVQLAGSTVKRATLHNADEIKRKGIRVGDTVIVQKAGDIIPEVVKVLEHKKGSVAWKMPTICPVCGSRVVRVEGEAAHRCSDKNCHTIKLCEIAHFISRDAFDIEGVGEKQIKQFLDAGLISDSADLFILVASDIEKLERQAKTSSQNIVKSIQSKKEISLDKFLYALGIRNVGKQTAIDIATWFGSLNKVETASVEELIQVDGIAEVVAQSVYDYFRSVEQQKLVKKIQDRGVKVQSVKKMIGSLSGKTFVLTGTLQKYTRDEVGDLIRSKGGRVSSSVSRETDYILVGGNPGSKAKKAEKLDVKIITESEFTEML